MIKRKGADYLSIFYPEKLSVEFKDGVTVTKPVIPRRYTLTHSDITGDLFLTIGIHYAWDKINPMRDEVLGEWKQMEPPCIIVFIYISIKDNITKMQQQSASEIFRRELPLALTAIDMVIGFFPMHTLIF